MSIDSDMEQVDNSETAKSGIGKSSAIETADSNAVRKARENFFRRVWSMYSDGFRNMTVGRYLWAIILVKLAILFLVFRLFFFPDILQENYDTDEERAEAVRSALTGKK